MFQVALVSYQHNDDVGVGVVSQLLQPSSYVGIRRVFGDIVHEQRSDRPTIVAAQSTLTFSNPE
jgi:hypothetical protein